MRRIKSHTLTKLSYFKKYISAYLNATKRVPEKYYIDAFAGSGKCILCDETYCHSKGGGRCIKCKKGKLEDGSPLIVLKLKNTFTGYILIELVRPIFSSLEDAIVNEVNPERIEKIELIQGDSNRILESIYKRILYDSEYTSFLFFLDPEGPELYWKTIESLYHKKADLLIVYPYDMSLVRLIKNDKSKLDKFYGTPKWIKIYKSGINPSDSKNKLLNFYLENIKKIGFKFVAYKQIRRRLREGKNLYHLILASNYSVAVKIMDDIFNKELDGQKKFKL